MKYALSFLIHAFSDACVSLRPLAGDEPGMLSLAHRAGHTEAGQARPSERGHTLLRTDSLGVRAGEGVPVVQAAPSLILFN